MKTPEPNTDTEAGVIADLALRSQPILVNVKREGVAIFPDGAVVNLENEALADNPRRRRANVKLISADAFKAYLQRFKIDGRTIIFATANEQGGSFLSIVDYHDVERIPAPAPELSDTGKINDGAKPQWGEHQVQLVLSPTPEWARWLANNNRLIAQAEFAEFIEDNAADIVAPDAAELLDMAQFLEATKTVTFKSGKNIGNGAQQLTYSEQIDENAGRRDNSKKFPTHMIVRLRPFVGSAAVEIPARLRFRISDGGKLSFQFVLDRPWKVIEGAFDAICADIEATLQTPVMLGTGSVVNPTRITGA